jgi:hypothetical protein
MRAMPEAKPAEVLIVAAKPQKALAARLASMLEERALSVVSFPDDDHDDARSLGRIAKDAGAIVVCADEALARGKLLDPDDLVRVLAPFADKLLLLAVDHAAHGALPGKSADVMPARGSLADLDDAGRTDVLRRLAHELVVELESPPEPEPVKPFEEYRLLFDSTERLVERRREAGQTFVAVNAALTAVVGFLAKDLGFSGMRLALVTFPLFVIGMLACRMWRRTILQYEALIDWRYRQLRRMERKRFTGSYRLFGREWDAIYAPRPKRSFGFSSLEAVVPRVFFLLHLLGLAGSLALGLGVLKNVG